MHADSHFEFTGLAEDPNKTIIYSESDNNSGTFGYYDFSKDRYDFIAHNYPEIPSEWISPKTKITYKAKDGLEIPAYLTLPPNKDAKNLPLIVMPHGGPHSRDRLGFDWQVSALASRGYAVLQPNFRGSTGYGAAFLEAGYGQWGAKMQTDLSDGVRHLVSQGIVDAKRVAIYGASYGGYAALAGATLDLGVYRCAISIAGVSDIKDMLEFEKSETGSGKSSTVLAWKRSWGVADLKAISPINYIDRVSIPILLIHGKSDTVVPVRQSQRMAKALKSAGKIVDYIELEKEDHWQSRPASRLEMITRIMDFLQKHNPA